MGRPSKYPEEFRREAVELYRSSDRPRCQIAESLGISDGSLAAWVKEADAAQAKMEDILKKTSAAGRDTAKLNTHKDAVGKQIHFTEVIQQKRTAMEKFVADKPK